MSGAGGAIFVDCPRGEVGANPKVARGISGDNRFHGKKERTIQAFFMNWKKS